MSMALVVISAKLAALRHYPYLRYLSNASRSYSRWLFLEYSPINFLSFGAASMSALVFATV